MWRYAGPCELIRGVQGRCGGISNFGLVPLCRRDALILLLELGGGHGLGHLVRERRSRSWLWIAWRPRGAARSGWYVCTFSVCSGAFFGIGGSLGLSGCSSRSVPSDLARAEAAYFEVCISALTSGLDVGVWRGAQESLGGRRAYESATWELFGTLQLMKTWSVTALHMLITELLRPGAIRQLACAREFRTPRKSVNKPADALATH